MRREVRALLHILVGAAVLHISLFSELYLRYVRKGLRPYLIASGTLLVAVGLIGAAVAARELLRPKHDADAPDAHHGHGHGTPDAHHGHGHGRGARSVPGRHTRITGTDLVDKVVHVDQSPIGR
ncbi:hypothetical protein AB0O00_39705, partial [Kitasatospora sp. NPDC093558]